MAAQEIWISWITLMNMKILRMKLKICKMRTNVRMSTKKYVFDANTRENTWLFHTFAFEDHLCYIYIAFEEAVSCIPR